MTRNSFSRDNKVSCSYKLLNIETRIKHAMLHRNSFYQICGIFFFFATFLKSCLSTFSFLRLPYIKSNVLTNYTYNRIIHTCKKHIYNIPYTRFLFRFSLIYTQNTHIHICKKVATIKLKCLSWSLNSYRSVWIYITLFLKYKTCIRQQLIRLFLLCEIRN